MGKKTLIYELTTPHDPCTIEAASDAVACVAVMLLGEGQYGCTREDGTRLPTMVLGDDDYALDIALDGCGVERMDDEAGEANDRLTMFLSKRGLEVANALDSFSYLDAKSRISIRERFAMHTASRQAELLADLGLAQRSSPYNLAARASKFAQRLRRRHEVAQEVTRG